jgi:hypothetical protein
VSRQTPHFENGDDTSARKREADYHEAHRFCQEENRSGRRANSLPGTPAPIAGTRRRQASWVLASIQPDHRLKFIGISTGRPRSYLARLSDKEKMVHVGKMGRYCDFLQF